MASENDDKDDRRLKVQINERDLLCVNGCGFYGTPQWGNRCSKCWHAHQILEKRNLDYAKNRTLLSFENFQERRKQSMESRSMTIKKIFKSPMLTSTSSDSLNQQAAPRVSPTSTPITVRPRVLSPDSRDAREAFTDFLVHNLPSSILQDVTRHTTNAVHRIQELRVSADDLSELVQNFYNYLSDKLNHKPFFNDASCTVKVQDVLEEMEKYICVCCYSKLFCPNSAEEVADLSLQERIRSLNWVTAGFLETKLDFSKQKVRDLLDDAISEMIDINSHRRADEKLDCLIRCSHKIFDALKESSAPTSADEFLPSLIYVLMKGNPPQIQSNVKFISRFALASRILSGESGYFFTNLSCAMQFVQDMNHDSLKMDRSEFEAYTSGEMVPPLASTNCGCNQALGSMERSLDRVNQLIEKRRTVEARLDAIEKSMTEEAVRLDALLRDILSRYPTEEYKKLNKEVERNEKETAELCSLSSGSGRSSDEDGDRDDLSDAPNNDAAVVDVTEANTCASSSQD